MTRARHSTGARPKYEHRGIVMVLTAFALVVIFAFVAMAVDSGRIALTKTEMQNGVDAAALAAAQEIAEAVKNYTHQGMTPSQANAAAIVAAGQMAADVAAANGVFVDSTIDVQFGARRYDASTGKWPIEWNASPYNTVRVVARRTAENTSAPDGRLPLAFGWAVGRESVEMSASATAFVESRDIVVCLDFSASMNDDSSMNSFNSLGQSNVEASLDAMWNALIAADPKWPGTTESKFSATGFGEIDTCYGTYISSSDVDTIFENLGLDAQNPDGSAVYPFPQAGRYGNGNPKSKPSYWTSSDRWKDYIRYVKRKNGTYRKRYGYRSLLDYLQEKRFESSQSEDLWRTPHYPFNAVKEGCSLFLTFLTDLDFGDEVGIVSYGGYSMKEMTHNDGEVTIDISSNPITNDLATLNTLQRRHQAGDYDGWTGMGYAIKDAKELLTDHIRYGARPTMLIMTDGQTNQGPSNWSLPGDFDWSDWTDYDGDGSADYTTTDKKKQYAFWEATEAISHGVTIHTMAVGQGADRDLMRAIAFAGQGVYISVPGGTSISQLQSQVLDAFEKIAAEVPPAKLVYELSVPE